MKVKKLLAGLCTVLALALCFAFAACTDKEPKPTPATEYTVTFDANGGTLTGNATVKVESGKTITGAPTAAKEEHDFAGWYTLATDGDKIDLSTYEVTADVKLFAHYTAKQTPPSAKIEVTFNANGGKISGETKLEVDENGNIMELPEAIRTGYRFDAWYTAAEGGEEVDPMFDVIDESTTLYAHWIKTYVVTFNAGAGTLEGSVTLTVDENAQIVGAPEAVKPGDEFHGWYTAAEGGDKIDLNTYTVTGDVTLYAHFGVITMPVKTLKNHEGTKVGYRIEAEEAKVAGTQNSDNQAHPGTFLEDVANASGGHSIGYFGKTGNTMTLTFSASAAGKATLSFSASSANIYIAPDWSAFYPIDQEVSTSVIKVTVNGTDVSFETTTLRGSYENWTFNKYWDPINLGEIDVLEGFNSVVVTSLGDSAPNFDCLDIRTELTLTSANGDAASGEASLPAPEVAYDKNVTGKLIVVDHADGPAVEKAVLTFVDDIPATAIATNPFSVGGMGVAQTDKVYLSDANGNKVADGVTTSKSVTIEYAYAYSGWGPAGNVKPFNYNQQTGRNTWKEISSYTFTLKDLTLGGTTYTTFTGTFTAEYSIPELDKWDINGSYTDGEITLKYASFAPVANGKTGKKPLIVWLHGAGEGGTDPSIVLLGNQVVNLGKDTIQKYFVTDTCAGAYVLAPQSPTMWMDNGNGQQGGSNVGESIYTESLFKLIQKFVTEHTDIDASRVYIGGCSNGGWMTVEMLSKHGEFFAAAFPIAVPFDKTAGMTDEEFTRLVNVPMWITHAKVDPTVKIGNFSTPANWWEQGTFESYAELNSNSLYIELLKAGATNVHYSLFADVSITGETDAATYNGHYSWIYVLRDECSKVQATTGTGENGAFVLADINENSTATVTVNGEEVTLWGWLAAQSKTPAQA